MKAGLRKNMLIVAMLLIAFLTVMSVVGAFIGGAKGIPIAKAFFNSTPMAVFWCVLLVVMLASFFIYPSLRKRWPLLALHLGCCLILAGGLWGSRWSHEHFGDIARDRGVMILRDGQVSPMLFDEAMTTHERLPFSVRLVKTWATYYDDNPHGMVKDYYSTLEILEEGQAVKKATIEVNKPLYYGGYHFYQHTFGTDQFSSYSGLLVTSVRGVWLVFAGYALIFVGLIWHFWWGVLRRAAMKEAQS